MKTIELNIPSGKKIYFASDFHLGAPNLKESHLREKRIVRWLDEIKNDASALFLVGDIFDFWFEYKKAVPKGFIRFQGKLAELVDGGLPIYLFTGNHDLWMFGYFREELDIEIFKEPITLIANNHKMLIGHGDGLGPGDRSYKILKKIFTNKVNQWLFRQLHPDLGITLATKWSGSSRASSSTSETEKFLGEREWLWVYSKEIEKETHHDFYIFGHRHLPLDLKVNENSRYINLGEWVNYNTFASFNGKDFVLEKYDEE
jgi:UDP-2,3-diacylglucosamine hydrolase